MRPLKNRSLIHYNSRVMRMSVLPALMAFALAVPAVYGQQVVESLVEGVEIRTSEALYIGVLVKQTPEAYYLKTSLLPRAKKLIRPSDRT